MKKIDRFKSYMKQHQSLLMCPVCQKDMLISGNSVICEQNHSFDIAKKGYINFMTQPVQTKYDKELFEARYQIISSGLYDPLHQKIGEFIEGVAKIIDLGCGEGSHLAHIRQHMDDEVVCAGVDIAKEGVMTASKNHMDSIWCVGDLAHTPFQGSSFDVVLNILSPANYKDFKRLLTEDGTLIKVIPQSDYLKELRELFYGQEGYSNDDTLERFQEIMPNVKRHRLTYKRTIEPELLPSLIKMTPLTWDVKVDDGVNLTEVTIDLEILLGKFYS